MFTVYIYAFIPGKTDRYMAVEEIIRPLMHNMLSLYVLYLCKTITIIVFQIFLN